MILDLLLLIRKPVQQPRLFLPTTSHTRGTHSLLKLCEVLSGKRSQALRRLARPGIHPRRMSQLIRSRCRVCTLQPLPSNSLIGGNMLLRLIGSGGKSRLRRRGRSTDLRLRELPDRLHLATVVPPFRRGSGGRSTIMHLLRGLESRGHRCSVWIEGPGDPALFADWFGAPGGGVHAGFGGWNSADVALATGWQTAHRVLRLPGCGARAYLVQDHEPDFHGASAERMWAEETYRLGVPCIAASPWLAGLLRERYGAQAEAFDLGVDHTVYRPAPGAERRAERVVFYARASTPRRAVPLGLLALEELHRRRPTVEIVLFGEALPVAAPFPHRHAGVLPGAELAQLGRARAVADQPLAGADRDARLRPSRRRRGEREHARDVRRRRPRGARRA